MTFISGRPFRANMRHYFFIRWISRLSVRQKLLPLLTERPH